MTKQSILECIDVNRCSLTRKFERSEFIYFAFSERQVNILIKIILFNKYQVAVNKHFTVTRVNSRDVPWHVSLN